MLNGKVAIVTGAAGEIGRVIAADLLESGASVVWVGRRERPLRAALAALHGGGDHSLPVRADIRSETDVHRMVRRTLDRFGRIDILVNNAAQRGPTVPLARLTPRAWREVLETNLTGAFLCARECLPHMTRRREGRIINMSSMAGRMAYPLRASYAASKWGLIGLTKTLAQEAGPFNVLANVVCPGPVEGAAMQQVIERRARALGVSVRAARRQFERSSALGRMVTAEDVSRTVMFLCSKSASSITGQVIEVSAGFGLWPG